MLKGKWMSGNGKNPSAHKHGLTFDLRKVTAKDMKKFFAATREQDTDGQAETLARVVVVCPKEWGDPTDPETYANLPYFGEFKDVIEAFVNESNAKN